MNKNFLHIALAALMLLSISIPALAQGKGSGWTKEMLEYKHDFIAEQTEMTQAQRDKFMPMYEAMEKEIYNANRTAREQARKVQNTSRKVSDQEYATAAKAMSQVKVKEGEIESRYYDKFAKILSKKQMFQLKQAELRFTRQMLSKGRRK